MQKRFVVAVSGGVDSVALLDMLARLPGSDLVVAHFDHGIRDDSAEDARFVKALAAKYGAQFEGKREELGPGASEQTARQRRYAFLHKVAARHDAPLVTAHHLDDAVESVAINLTRGTGWRGLAVMDSPVMRPLLDMSKQDLLDYARRRGLRWREDSTNASDRYLRNRLRKKATTLPHDHKRQLLALRHTQADLKRQIEQEVRSLVGPGPRYDRHFLTHIDPIVALECLRVMTAGKLTRPQLERALLAIKVAAPGSTYQAGAGVNLRFTSRNFTSQLIK